jgi:hypothetical protein
VREAEAAVGSSARDGSVMAEMLYEMPWRSPLAAVWSVVPESLEAVEEKVAECERYLR